MIVISCGIGNDSIALLIEAHKRSIRPDLIVFADTGSEHPRTYEYIPALQKWLASVGFPDLTIVRWIRRTGVHLPLHQMCVERSELPSAAYGFAGCSSKFKRQPIDKHVKHHPDVVAAFAKGEPVERWIGFNADEQHRLSGNLKADGYTWRAPLVEWDIGRAEVRQLINCSPLPLPGKSSCWLCPHMKPAEVRDLKREYPELYNQALAIEAAADLHTLKGLGRQWAWAEVEKQQLMFETINIDAEDMPCMCAT